MRDASGESEVNQLYSFLCFIKKNIFKFDVAMCYIALMAVVDCLNNLAPQEFSLELWHLSVWFHLKVAV